MDYKEDISTRRRKFSLSSNESRNNEYLNHQNDASTNKTKYPSTYDLNPKPVSLINMGANCYLNSGLQAISACNYFVKEIHELQSKYPELKKLKIFKTLINVLKNGGENCLNISSSDIFQQWNKPGQQDSFELLSYVINQVYDELRKKMKLGKTNLNEWFEVHLPSRIIILHEITCCPQIQISSRIQSDLALHLPIFKDNNKSIILQNLIDSFFKAEKIEDYFCEENQCDGSKAKKLAKLCDPLPNTICIHLQRLLWKNGMMNKIDEKVEFDQKIIIKKEFIFPQNGMPQNELQDREYQLTSVIVHYGTSSFGHYICYKIFDNSWYYTSDSSIRKVAYEEVKRCEAYILYYEIAKGDYVTQITSNIEGLKLNDNLIICGKLSSAQDREKDSSDNLSQRPRENQGDFNTSNIEQTENINYKKLNDISTSKTQKPIVQHNREFKINNISNSTSDQTNNEFYKTTGNMNHENPDYGSDDKYLGTLPQHTNKVSINNDKSTNLNHGLSNYQKEFNNSDMETRESRNRTNPDHRSAIEFQETPPQLDYEVANNLMTIFDQISDRSLSMIIHSLSACTNFVNRLKYFRSYITSTKLKIFIDKIISNDSPFHSKLDEKIKHNEPDIFQSITSIMMSIFDEVKVNLQMGKAENLVNFQNPLMILLESQIKCLCENVISVPNQWVFSLQLTDAYHDLQILINKIFEDEHIRDYDCDGTNCRYNIGDRSTRMCRPLPETICIRVMNNNRWSRLKLSEEIVMKSSFVTEKKFDTDDNIRSTLDEQWYRHGPSSSLKYKLKSIISNEYSSAYSSAYSCLRNYKNDWYLTTGHNVTKVHGIESCKYSYLLLFEADIIKKNERLSMVVGAHTEIAREDCTNEMAKYKPKTRIKPFCLKPIGCDHYFDVCFQAVSSCDKLINDMKYSTDFVHITTLVNYDVPADDMSRNVVDKWKRSYQTNLFQYMSKLLNDLFEECKTKPIHGNVTLTMKCSSCGNVEEYDQSNLAFNIFINRDCYDTIKLQESINHIFQVQNMFDHKCDKCSSGNVKIKKTFCRPYPKTLLIHIEHLIWEHTKNRVLYPNVKFRDSLLIPVVDESSHYSFLKYHLKSMLSYDYNDYYTCYRKFDNQWYKINGTYSCKPGEYDVLHCRPYLMFYELSD